MAANRGRMCWCIRVRTVSKKGIFNENREKAMGGKRVNVRKTEKLTKDKHPWWMDDPVNLREMESVCTY